MNSTPDTISTVTNLLRAYDSGTEKEQKIAMIKWNFEMEELMLRVQNRCLAVRMGLRFFE